jgi:hypothetical protein
LGFSSLLLVSLIILGSGAGQPVTNKATNTTAVPTSSTQSLSAVSSSVPATQPANTTPAQSTPSAKPALRQDLAFQGDPAYCDAHYKDNGDGTTTWTLDVKQTGELITHLSDKGSQIYRHDVKVQPGEYAYTAPVAINDVSEINGLLYVGNDNHPCNISPQQ